ncbi:hypothetical protein U9M48_013747 [Paspalum notatum var. saurae]|uniref:Uncharacterized protein n=1 Tax=Paspalum notatum var. saurae TaxID=547442 RepID=A0AAQ3T047_PASNO
MHSVRSLHTLGMHIDPALAEREIPVIEEPKTRNPSCSKKSTRSRTRLHRRRHRP